MRVPSIALAAAIVAGAALPAPALAQDTAQPPQASLDDTGRLTLDFRVDRFVVRDGRFASASPRLPALPRRAGNAAR
jgi:hypothetical protein